MRLYLSSERLGERAGALLAILSGKRVAVIANGYDHRDAMAREIYRAEIFDTMAEFRALGLPSCPPELIHVSDAPDRPQPRLDRERGGGMTTTVGRVREDPALENGLKYVLLSHNTKMGAAKGAILTGEWLASKGYIG